MVISKIEDLDLNQLIKIFEEEFSYNSPLAKENIQATLLVSKHFENFKILTIKNDSIIATNGVINQELDLGNSFDYAQVPLGLILSGEIVVSKNNKATKILSKGDFLGLFETGDWIISKRKRLIGDWTLKANQEVKIIFFSENTFLQDSLEVKEFTDYLINSCRINDVPQPITDMLLLDWVAEHTTHLDLSDYAILTHTHLLPSNIALFRHLAHLVNPWKMFLLEKPYSTVASVSTSMIKAGCEIIPVLVESNLPYAFSIRKSLDFVWDTIEEEFRKGKFTKLLILDDGGDIWLSIPQERFPDLKIAGVEQTQRGITRLLANNKINFPIVSVASSGIKKIIEADFIGRYIVQKLFQKNIINHLNQVGIIGAGSIGWGVFEELKKLGFKPNIYDSSNYLNKKSNIASLDQLINSSDIVIGTTGTDCLKGIAFDRIHGSKILVSASSSDIEFSSLLKIKQPNHEPFGTITVNIHDQLKFYILNGGFPFNFDREGNASPTQDIVLTRALLYAGIMQAAEALENNQKNDTYMLDKKVQRKLLQAWINYKQEIGETIKEEFKNIEEIVSFSSLDAEFLKELPSTWED